MNGNGTLRLGIVGGGYIGRSVGGGFVDHPDATVAALTDIDEAVLDSTGEALGVSDAARYHEYESMLEEEQLDAVLVGTPHTLHYEQVLAAMDRDLHVLCDKPLTTDLDHARELRDRTRASDEVLMIGYQRHLNPSFGAVKERWEQNGLTPEWITAEISQDWIDRFNDTWRCNPDLSGGGYLYDTGSHLLDAILWTTGLTPTAVSAQMTFVDEERRVDDWADVTIAFEEGAKASVTTYGRTPCVREHIHVWDQEGSVYVDGVDWKPREMLEIDADSSEHSPAVNRSEQRTKAEAFIAAIRGEEPPAATAQDGLRVTAVTEAAYESAWNDGEWVDIDPADVVID
ncbi:Gfo/Idh/MocA family protein [Halocatena marina]|uniref:Gfo/Idh/MocA family protein n=1 Tax=Halocatena marina TaxID=2934937 RepID=A0ABD5YR74_9EURY|nr:Gfo/Idh/MocA family oxidoreductase [Halocatena marina]